MPVRNALLLSLGLVVAASSAASAQERCSGTLCDWYYGSSPAPAPDTAAKPAAPTPLMVPKGGILGMFSGGNSGQGAPGQPATRPMLGVGGGGIASMARGEAQERCTGTLCDFYYGGPPPEKPAAQPPTAAPDQTAALPAESAEPAEDVAPTTTRRRRGRGADADVGVRYEPARCAATGRDPWSCYR